ncbi:hypothetical protein LSUE1_G004850 [Lachnellula suecica]|uniref:Uncharacterized protein n=1 Tax=Lachnellula suecica TaxID=602035 RepID=A0A8T9C3E2_9HELO|nr:hypothetical protein LSUE1_G004850 [Lachnellula suecica]
MYHRVSGYSESQASNQLAILAYFTNTLRQGNYTDSIGQPSKIVHMGLSFGSVLTTALIASYPNISDGVALTGSGFNGTNEGALWEAFRLNIASTVSPGKWPGRDSGYLTFGDPFANSAIFLHPGMYDREVLLYTQEIRHPLAAMEMVSEARLNLLATHFTGPVLVISGEFDFAVCGGNCNGVFQHPAAEIFASAKTFEAVVHPGVGHGINFSFNATGAYSVVMDFVAKNGL